MITEWNIQSRAHACTACGAAFTDQQHYHTLLFDEKADFRRSDVCQACWEKQYSEGARDRKGFISYWQGVYQAPPPPTEAIKKETAESLLRKLIELNDPRYIPAGYILAVMLERKRLLKVKEQLVREGQRVFIYEHPHTGEVFTILDPDLKLDQLQQVQHDVAALLEHGLEGAAPGASPAPTEAAAVTPEAQASGSTPSDAAPPAPGSAPAAGPEAIPVEAKAPAEAATAEHPEQASPA